MKSCFNCGAPGEALHGYIICAPCKSKLRLFSDQTIHKHSSKNPEAFKKDIKARLDFIDKDFIRKKIKLLHVLDRLSKIKK